MKELVKTSNPLFRKTLTCLALIFLLYTLTYFKLIPLVKDNAIKSPEQARVQPLVITPFPIGTDGKMYWIVTPVHPVLSFAAQNHYQFTPISGSTFHAMGPIEITVSYTFSATDSSQNGVAGFLLDNKITYNDPSYERLQFFYWQKNRELLMQFQHGDTSQYTSITPVSSQTITLTFFISSDGKTVSVVLPDGTVKKVVLNTSLYKTSNILQAATILSPSAKITLRKLIYRSAF